SETLEMLKTYFPDQAKRKSIYIQYNQLKVGMKPSAAVWDFLWNLVCYAQNGLCIVPEKNLVTNIGFGEDATHTHSMNPLFANLSVHPLEFPLRHPQFVYADSRPERALEKQINCVLPFKTRCGRRLRHTLATVSNFIETMP